jgi:hypothetical protein
MSCCVSERLMAVAITLQEIITIGISRRNTVDWMAKRIVYGMKWFEFLRAWEFVDRT